ncbi:MAG: hypothetical protein U5R06_16410 [candidate division KSB1 bacterium]|nr:hypothetical protein [candidate division KSB1 bacterium]
MESFVDLSDCSIANQPDNINVFIVRLKVLDSDSISGNTANEFVGSYSIHNNKIDFNIHSLTEINEPEWAKKFLEAAKNTDYVFIRQSKLFIFYEQSTKVMVFTEIKGE